MAEKKQGNLSFILTVVLMSSLILALLIPTGIAWFTSHKEKEASTIMEFGSVAIGAGNTINLTNTNSGERGINYILPGDAIEFEFEVYNAGSVDTYAKIYYEAKVLYNDTDITPLLFDDTDPLTQPYLSVTDISLAKDPNFYNNGSAVDQVFVLPKNQTQGNGKIVTGVLDFAFTMPNEVTDGVNTYILNGAPAGTKLELKIDINMATMQKDNNALITATAELSKMVDSMLPAYTLTYVDGVPALTIGDTVVATSQSYKVSSTAGTDAYAFIANVGGEKTLLAVVGEGDMKDYTNRNQPWRTARTSITEVVVDEGITAIGNYAFYGCTNLTRVEIPSTVSKIGSNAFGGGATEKLTELYIPGSVTDIGASAFTGCSSLQTLNISEGVKNIGNSAFGGCSSLTKVSLPSTLESIDGNPFRGGVNIDEIVIPNTNKNYKVDGNCIIEIATNTIIGAYKNFTIPSYVEHLGSYSLPTLDVTSFEVPSGIKTIGNYVFSGCTNLTSISLPSSLTSIGISVFNGCTSLTSISLPSSLTSIGNYAFSGCSNLTSINLENVSVIGVSAFNNCTSLTSVTLPEGLSTIANQLFSGCSSLTSVIIPEGVTSIGASAFVGTALTQIVIPNTVTIIYDNAFNGVTTLTSLKLSNTLSEIYSNAFSGCTGLTEVIIPKSVTYIGHSAFNDLGEASIIYMEHGIHDDIRVDGIEENSPQPWSNNAEVYYYSETEEAGYWCYGKNGEIGIWGINYWELESAEGNEITAYIEDGVLTFKGKGTLSNISGVGTYLADTVIISNGITGLDASISGNNNMIIIIAESVKSIGAGVFHYGSTIYFEATSDDGMTFGDHWNNGSYINDGASYYFYSETNQSGYWHYVDGVPTLW